MRVQVAADVHGACKKLKEAIHPDLPLFLLGDNLNLVDFHTLSGVAAEVLGKKDIARILLALGTGGPKKALGIAKDIFFNDPDCVAHARRVVAREYAELADILPDDCIVLHGNVDYPDLLREALGDRYVDAAVREIEGIRFGLLSGTGYYPYSIDLPGEATDEIYTEKLRTLGEVDVLCTHFPPAVDELTWDTVAKRDEGGGTMIVEYIRETKPGMHLFGHIHNPKVAEARLGETSLVNVGGFRYNGKVHVLEL